MPLPLVAGVMFGAGAISSSAYSLKQAYETQNYWKDYGRNTGLSPRYPFRSGMYSPYRDIANMSVGVGALYGRSADFFAPNRYDGPIHPYAPGGRYYHLNLR